MTERPSVLKHLSVVTSDAFIFGEVSFLQIAHHAASIDVRRP